eukprot:5160012-Amphidinium_carterae.1
MNNSEDSTQHTDRGEPPRCNSGGLKFTSLSSGHELFTPHTQAEQAYLILTGEMLFYSACTDPSGTSNEAIAQDAAQDAMPRRAKMKQRKLLSELDLERQVNMARYTKDLQRGDWVCDVALFFEWAHQGTLLAEAPCDLLEVEAASFVEALRPSVRIRELTY